MLADSALSTSTAGAWDERQAGSAPHSMPANRENTAIPITTLWSMLPFRVVGLELARKNHANVFDVHVVNARATAPATMESTTPSSTICRTSCMRFAPSDCRIASSRRRDTNRTSVSVATFAQVSNSTTAAKASRMGSVAAMYPLAPNGERHMGSSVIRLSPRCWSGYAATILRITVSRSWAAWPRLTPGRNLPITFSQTAPPLRCVIRHSSVPRGSSVTHRSSRIPGIAPTTPSGATPITVTGCRAISIDLPTIARSSA